MSLFRLLGNLVWLLCGGLATAFEYFFSGLLWSITIIGIPIGLQCFKLGMLMLWPFGATVSESHTSPLGCIGNVIWCIFFGWVIALTHLAAGLALCITIIGIPFGMKHFSFAKLAFTPFGREITY